MTINPVGRVPRKTIRLPAAAYRDPGSARLVTIGCASRRQVFADAAIARAVSALLGGRACTLDAGLHLWFVMPDHAHLIVEVRAGGAGLVEFLQDIKGRSTRIWWAHGGAGPLWQRSFHDRGLRGAKEFEAAVRYVLSNPIESGLIADWREYPWLGGSLLADDVPPSPSSPSPPSS